MAPKGAMHSKKEPFGSGYVRQEVAHPVTSGLRLLNISCLRNPFVEFPGQTGFIARRAVEWRLQNRPEVGTN
jgi:hypothetical protein